MVMKKERKPKGRLLLMGSSAFNGELPPKVRERIDRAIDCGMTIIVGEARGANRLFQDYLKCKGYRNVIVGHAKSMRYNIGNWKTVQYGQNLKERERRMIEDCDSAIIIWMDKSSVIAENLESLKRLNKPTYLHEYSSRNNLARAGGLDPNRNYSLIPFVSAGKLLKREKRGKKRDAIRVCTFNLNSIRARKDLVTEWLNHRNNDLDILCFQETKVVDEDFPYDNFERLGYGCKVYGQKSYNGVAICSRFPLGNVSRGFDDDYWDDQKRIICARVEGIDLIDVYAPHGDLRGTDKYHQKLKWYNKLLSFLKENYSSEEKLMVMGDFNVARADLDVFDPEATKDGIGTLSEERDALQQILDWGLIDSYRYVYPEKQQFTWWDYIGGAIWRNEGMRIDYVLCTRPLLEGIEGVEVDLWPRMRRTPKPSDHAPVIVELDMSVKED